MKQSASIDDNDIEMIMRMSGKTKMSFKEIYKAMSTCIILSEEKRKEALEMFNKK